MRQFLEHSSEQNKNESEKLNVEAFFECVEKGIEQKKLFSEVFEKTSDEYFDLNKTSSSLLRVAGIKTVTDMMIILAHLEQEKPEYHFNFNEESDRVLLSVVKK